MPLLFVLWTVALLAIIAAASQSSGTVSYTLARNAAEVARQEAQAEAVLNLVVLLLMEGPARQQSRTILYDGEEFKVEIQDELGRIDLNHADGRLLVNLFRAVSTAPQEAEKLADRIVDWRDPDDLRRLNGAEAREYREAGLLYGPRNGSFQSKDELRLVLGMTPELFRKVEPALTIHSGKPGIDPRLAPPLVRQTLAGRDRIYEQDISRAPATIGGAFAGRAFAVCLTSLGKKNPFTWQAVIRLTGDPAKPYWLLEWYRKLCK